METRVVEEARVRADVKRAHIRALKARLRAKKNCCRAGLSGWFLRHRGKRRERKMKRNDDEKPEEEHGDSATEDLRHGSRFRQTCSQTRVPRPSRCPRPTRT